jgi:hypothetical protein
MFWDLPSRTADKTVRPRRGKAMNRPCVALEVLERARMVVAIVASVKDRKVALLAFTSKRADTGRPSAVDRLIYSHLRVTTLVPENRGS